MIKKFNLFEHIQNENINWEFDEEEELEPDKKEVKKIEKYLDHNYPVISKYIKMLNETINFVFLKNRKKYIGLNGFFSNKENVENKIYLEIKNDIHYKYSEPSIRRAIKNFINKYETHNERIKWNFDFEEDEKLDFPIEINKLNIDEFKKLQKHIEIGDRFNFSFEKKKL